jgi:hypothetical protein
MLTPMADLINHYSREHCTTEMCHLGLEQEKDKAKREAMQYRKLRGNYDINLLLPKTYFDAGDRKSNALHFVEAFSRKVYRYQNMEDCVEQKEALDTAAAILDENDDVDIWDLPNWYPDFAEDNDSSESEKDEEPESEDEFFDQVEKLKAKLASKPKKYSQATNSKNPSQNELILLARESQEKRKSVMDFEAHVAPTPIQAQKALKKQPSIDVKKVEVLDQSESFSEHQSEYPWFSTTDSDVMPMSNIDLLRSS